MSSKRDKIRLISSAGTGHFYTTDKNKKTTPNKMEFLKYDPVVRKHVIVQGRQDQVSLASCPKKRPLAGPFSWARDGGRFRRWALEAAAQGEMQIHALRQLLALHAQQRQPRGMDVQLLLLDGAQIALADAVARLRQFEGALVVGHGCAAGVARARPGSCRRRGRSPRRRGRARPCGRSRRRPPSARACGFPPASSARRPGRSGPAASRPTPPVGFSKSSFNCRMSLSMARDVGVEDDARQPRRLRLAHAVEGRGHAALGGDHVGPALQHFQRHAGGDRAGQLGEVLARLRVRRRDSGRAAVPARAASARGRSGPAWRLSWKVPRLARASATSCSLPAPDLLALARRASPVPARTSPCPRRSAAAARFRWR